MPRKPDPKSKAGFVRAQPASLSPAEVVEKAKAAGIKLTIYTVYAARAGKNRKARVALPSTTSVATTAAAKRGPGRPRKVSSAALRSSASRGVGGGIEAEIERIVEAKVNAILRERLGTIFR